MEAPQRARAIRGPSRARAVELVSANFGALSIFVVFSVLFVFFSVEARAFLSAENLANVGRQIAPTIVVGTLMTFVITDRRDRPVRRVGGRVERSDDRPRGEVG